MLLRWDVIYMRCWHSSLYIHREGWRSVHQRLAGDAPYGIPHQTSNDAFRDRIYSLVLCFTYNASIPAAGLDSEKGNPQLPNIQLPNTCAHEPRLNV